MPHGSKNAPDFKQEFISPVYATGKGIANPSTIPIPWIHSPVASELGTTSLNGSCATHHATPV
ncbi:MAG: hypothetical protein IJ601_08965, partial [Acidaminococcaceae bacterium]|nr:hypothetical protein [Acidaminococcaceae bacterium]